MKRGSWRAACIAVSFFTLSASAFAQSVEPVAPPAPYPPPVYVPPPPPYQVGPARLRYEDGDPVPPGYRVVHRTRGGMVIAGTVMFCVSYGIAISVAMIDDFKDQTSWLAIPLAGPWLMMYTRSRPSCDSQSGSGCVEQGLESILRVYLAIDGVVQAAGVGMFGFGMAGRDILVRDYSIASVRVVPGPVGRSGYGAMLTGRF